MKNSIYHWGILLLMLSSSCSLLNKSSQKSKIELEGTNWMLEYTTTQNEERIHIIEFRSNGVLYTHHPNDDSHDNDTWIQEGNKLTISINDGYAIYKGEIISRSKIEGIATNEVDAEWPWIAKITANK